MDAFRIVYSGLFKAELLRLSVKARSEGRLSKAKPAITELIALLETDPNSVGEIVYTLKHIGLPVRHVVSAPWSLHFAVDGTWRLVYLSKIELLDRRRHFFRRMARQRRERRESRSHSTIGDRPGDQMRMKIGFW